MAANVMGPLTNKISIVARRVQPARAASRSLKSGCSKGGAIVSFIISKSKIELTKM